MECCHPKFFFQVFNHLHLYLVSILDDIDLFYQDLFGDLLFLLLDDIQCSHAPKPLKFQCAHTGDIVNNTLNIDLGVMGFLHDLFDKKSPGIFIQFGDFQQKIKFSRRSQERVDRIETLRCGDCKHLGFDRLQHFGNIRK